MVFTFSMRSGEGQSAMELEAKGFEGFAGGSESAAWVFTVSFLAAQNPTMCQPADQVLFNSMLAVMTFNWGVLCAVLAGIVFGELFLGQYTQHSSGWADGACHDG